MDRPAASWRRWNIRYMAISAIAGKRHFECVCYYDAECWYILPYDCAVKLALCVTTVRLWIECNIQWTCFEWVQVRRRGRQLVLQVRSSISTRPIGLLVSLIITPWFIHNKMNARAIRVATDSSSAFCLWTKPHPTYKPLLKWDIIEPVFK